MGLDARQRLRGVGGQKLRELEVALVEGVALGGDGLEDAVVAHRDADPRPVLRLGGVGVLVGGHVLDEPRLAGPEREPRERRVIDRHPVANVVRLRALRQRRGVEVLALRTERAAAVEVQHALGDLDGLREDVVGRPEPRQLRHALVEVRHPAAARPELGLGLDPRERVLRVRQQQPEQLEVALVERVRLVGGRLEHAAVAERDAQRRAHLRPSWVGRLGVAHVVDDLRLAGSVRLAEDAELHVESLLPRVTGCGGDELVALRDPDVTEIVSEEVASDPRDRLVHRLLVRGADQLRGPLVESLQPRPGVVGVVVDRRNRRRGRRGGVECRATDHVRERVEVVDACRDDLVRVDAVSDDRGRGARVREHVAGGPVGHDDGVGLDQGVEPLGDRCGGPMVDRSHRRQPHHQRRGRLLADDE